MSVMRAYNPLIEWASPNPAVPTWIWAIIITVFVIALLACAWVDLKVMLIPNRITYPLIVSGAALAPFLWTDPLVHLVAGAVSGLIMLIPANMKVKGNYAMGMGDVKLYTAAGLWMGFGVMPVFVLASLIGVIHGLPHLIRKDRSARIPHGPHIVAAMLIMLVVGIV